MFDRWEHLLREAEALWPSDPAGLLVAGLVGAVMAEMLRAVLGSFWGRRALRQILDAALLGAAIRWVVPLFLEPADEARYGGTIEVLSIVLPAACLALSFFVFLLWMGVYYVAVAIDAARGVYHEGTSYASWTRTIEWHVYRDIRDQRRARWRQIAGPLVGRASNQGDSP